MKIYESLRKRVFPFDERLVLVQKYSTSKYVISTCQINILFLFLFLIFPFSVETSTPGCARALISDLVSESTRGEKWRSLPWKAVHPRIRITHFIDRHVSIHFRRDTCFRGNDSVASTKHVTFGAFLYFLPEEQFHRWLFDQRWLSKAHGIMRHERPPPPPHESRTSAASAYPLTEWLLTLSPSDFSLSLSPLSCLPWYSASGPIHRSACMCCLLAGNSF